MRQTNYQLFDFLDFDTNLDDSERLWRACMPTCISEENGSVLLTIPFQKQLNSNEIKSDTSVARKDYTLKITQYGNSILRISIGIGQAPEEDSEMLQISPDLNKIPLSFRKETARSRADTISSSVFPPIGWLSIAFIAGFLLNLRKH